MYGAPIEFFNRETGKIETEKVYGEGFLRWAYGNPFGRLTVTLAVKRAWFSRWYGWRMDLPKSKSKVATFIEAYDLDPQEFAEPAASFQTFNDFFYRKLKNIARPIAPSPLVAVFPADGRHLAIQNLDTADQFYIKGQRFDLNSFLQDRQLAQKFTGGTMLISRLCPVDYHRYHFPISGVAGTTTLLNGHLRSVSPLALRRELAIFWENKRALTLIESPDFGSVLVAEIGATCVGSIHQTYSAGAVDKGQEKGYFSFGGSCVITLFEKDRITLDADLLDHSAQSRELYAKVGTQCGVANKPNTKS